jgi:hypothetical protein
MVCNVKVKSNSPRWKKRWTNIYTLAHVEEAEWDMRKEGLKPKSSGEAE